MLRRRDLEEGTVKDTKEDCCDKDVTTCRDFTAMRVAVARDGCH